MLDQLVIPGAGRRQLWSLNDPPDPALPLDEQLVAYRQLRDVLRREIRVHLLLTARLAMFPLRK